MNKKFQILSESVDTGSKFVDGPCPHCRTILSSGDVRTKKLNGTYYYYHNSCIDSRPIGTCPTHRNEILQNMWNDTKSATTYGNYRNN